MFIEARDLERNTQLQTEFCIIGAGAAGITLALELEAKGHDVIVLESGGFQYDEDTQKLCAGRAHGTFLDPKQQYLSRSRVRRFGGSTNHWNGWCAPLEPADLEGSDWAEHGGWPISRTDLDPYYSRAAPYLDIEAGFNDVPGFLSDDSVFEPFYFSLSAPTRFGLKYRKLLEQRTRVRVVLHANLTEVLADPSSGAVTSVVASTLEHHRVTVRAGRFVLACGGVENARVLMASAEKEGGVRTESEALGRFFMDHPITRVGHIVLAPNRKAGMATFKDRDVATGGRRGLLRPLLSVRRERQWQNALVVLDQQRQWHAGSYAKWIAKAGIAGARLAGIPGKVGAAPYFAAVKIAVEQTPNPESRLELLPERDALGMQRVRLRWKILDRDTRAMEQMVDQFRRRIGSRFEGRMRSTLVDGAPWEKAGGSNHHMGTTRMASSAAKGVVDSNSRVFGADNLYIAGSSVFSTCGAVNPTFTIVALAIRLADHLGAQA